MTPCEPGVPNSSVSAIRGSKTLAESTPALDYTFGGVPVGPGPGGRVAGGGAGFSPSATSLSDNGDLRCVSQWGRLDRNDDVVMRRTGRSGLEVRLKNVEGRQEVSDWNSGGYRSHAEYLFWSRKVCGLACLQSLLHAWTDVRLSLRELIERSLEWGCFVVEPSSTVQGLLYRPFMAWVNSEFGFSCRLVERMPVELSSREVGPGRVMIASVSAEIRDPDTVDPRRGGHLVLICAANDAAVRFHNPSGYSHNSESATLTLRQFDRFHARRGILITKRP